MVQCRFSPHIVNLAMTCLLEMCLKQGLSAHQVAQRAIQLIEREKRGERNPNNYRLLLRLADAFRYVYVSDMDVLDAYILNKAPDCILGADEFNPTTDLQELGLYLLPFVADPTLIPPPEIASMFACLCIGPQISCKRGAVMPTKAHQRILHHIILNNPLTTLDYRLRHGDEMPNIGALYGKSICARTMLHVVLFVEAVRSLPALAEVIDRHYTCWEDVQQAADIFTRLVLIGDEDARTAGMTDYILHHKKRKRLKLVFRFRHPYQLMVSLDPHVYPPDEMWSLIRELPAAHPYPPVFLEEAGIPPLAALTRQDAIAWLKNMTIEQKRAVFTMANLASVHLKQHTLHTNAMLLSPNGILAGLGIAPTPNASTIALCLACRTLGSRDCHVIVELHHMGYHCSRCQSSEDIVFVDLLAFTVHNFSRLGTALSLCYYCHAKSESRMCGKCVGKLPQIQREAQQREIARLNIHVCLGAHRIKRGSKRPVYRTFDNVPFCLCDYHAEMHPYLTNGDFMEVDVVQDIPTTGSRPTPS